jgi:hypothetical protein
MGLSSSQARLLNLTARMHQIEYKAAKLEAQKLQMANESTRVYEDYLEAMDKTKIQYKVLNTDGSVTYNDISSYNNLLSAGYALNYNGVVYDGSTAYTTTDGSAAYVATTPITVTSDNQNDYPGLSVGTYYQKLDGSGYVESSKVKTTGVTLNFEQLCKDSYGATKTPTGNDVETVITNLINSGSVTIATKRSDGTFANQTQFDFSDYETSVSTDTGLQEVTDEVNLKKAEAKYEADMKQIDLKDRKFDTDLAALDTERNAIKSEMETLKSVAKENVERTFKLFS